MSDQSSRRARGWIVLAPVAAFACGCAVGPDYRPPAIAHPDKFGAVASLASVAGKDAVDPARWWKAMNDTVLDALVEDAVQSNPDAEVALLRLEQARAVEAIVTGESLPELEASGGGGRGTGSDLTRGRAPNALRAANTGTGFAQVNYVAGFDAGWALDLFGYYRRSIEAAKADAQAAAAARDAVTIAVVSDVARAYVDLRGLQLQLEVLRRSVDTADRRQALVRQRFDRGLTNALDVTLARRESATLRAAIAPLTARIAAARDAIATLTGRFPDQLPETLNRPALPTRMPEAVAPGIPVDVLRRRPDVREAERTLAAATARVGVAAANLFPRVTLTGGIGYEGQGLGVTPAHGRSVWSFGPGAYWSLLDFGVLDGLVDIADLESRIRLARYRQVVLRSVAEVDTAIAAYSASLDRLLELDAALAASREAVELATQRYDRGLTDFLNVLDAERQEYALQGEYAAARQTSAEQFVALYRALGGGWEDHQAVPPARAPQPAVVAAFRRLLGRGDPGESGGH